MEQSYHKESIGLALYFHRLANPGGAERMICQLASALVVRGFRVYLISLDSPSDQSFFPVHDSVQWFRLNYSPGFFDKFRRTRVLLRILKNAGIQTLVGFVISGDKTVFAAAKLAGVNLVVAERNAPTMYWLRYNVLQRWVSFSLLHLADRITVQLPGFIAGYPATLRGRIEIIPNPVPVVMSQASPGIMNESGRYILLVVSRLDAAQKRVDCLIRAFSRVATEYPNWDLLIIGNGPENSNLHRLIVEFGLAGRVKIEPAMLDVFNVYAKVHLFAIPSLWEGFSNALAEAMKHGLPAVGFSGAAGVAELIGDGGWLAKGLDDEVALAGELANAMANDTERIRRGQVAAELMRRFEPEQQFDRWAELLGSLVVREMS
jgi:GalNAc-alpha-(1->4)-GalNAc-alpha-(1->3)-diNAcBac-PP-undecaprenol alpha-1,4-N-acetyl-D-galactosaminyltransferase